MAATTPPDPGAPAKPRFSRPMALVLFIIFLDVVGIGIIVPVLPFYARAFNADGFAVGLLFTAYAGLQFLTTPTLGALSDRYGRRPVLLLSLAGSSLGYLVMGFANSLAVLYIARAIAGATAGNIGAAQAYIADITTPQERTRSFGLMGAAWGTGFLFGPALGGLLSTFDERAPAFASAALLAATCMFGLFILPESLPPDRRTASTGLAQMNPVGVLVRLTQRPVLRGPLLATFLVSFAFAGFQTNFPVFTADQFGFGPQDVAQVFVALSLVGIFSQAVIVRRLSTRFRDVSITLVGLTLLAIGFASTGFAPDRWAIFAAAGVLALANSLWRPPLTSLLSKLVSPREQGMVNGGTQSIVALGSIIGPMWAGFIYDAIGRNSPYWTNALILLAATATVALTAGRTGATAGAPHTTLGEPAA